MDRSGGGRVYNRHMDKNTSEFAYDGKTWDTDPENKVEAELRDVHQTPADGTPKGK